jgi:hypothetical protein
MQGHGLGLEKSISYTFMVVMVVVVVAVVDAATSKLG